MPAQLTYPGVYVEEIPSGVRAITGVATSITAFIGRAARGRTDHPVTVTSFGDFERTFGGLWKESTLGFSVRDFFANGGSIAVIVRLFGGNDDNFKTSITRGTIEVKAADPGSWGNSLRIRVDHDTRDPDTSLGEQATSLFNLYVRDGTTGAIEEHRNVTTSIADHPRYLRNVLENESGLVRLTTPAAGSTAARPTKHSDTIPAGKTVWDQDTTSTAVGAVVTDGAAIGVNDFTGPGKQTAKDGLYALEDADLFNLLVIPPYTATGDVEPALVSEAHTYCQQRRAMVVVDGLSTWNDVGDVTGATISTAVGTIKKNGALFFPRLRQTNPLKDNQVETFSAAGAVAGVMARTDATRGVWKAPAGLDATLVGVPELSVPLSDAEIGQLNPLGVNCLRAMPAAGRVVWGSRTGEGADRLASEWKYIPVRRTALFIEESLYRGTQWVVFEPNDEPLWAQIRLNVGTFMNNLFRQGAFQGSTPREAYFVKCDSETTTRADIDLGIVNIHVGFAPLKPAEFVVIKLQQIAGQSAV